MIQPLRIKNAGMTMNGEQRDLFTTDRVMAEPSPDALAVDLSEYRILPGLVNAHDHLELNHFPRTRFREVYDNAHQWGEDVNARLDSPLFKALRDYPLKDRLFIGGLKNLLCGATTVMHHNPPHKWLFRQDFPVRVARRYGWVHSLHFSSGDAARASYAQTPPDVPWFIHLAEGTDAVAAGEYARLKALGCVGPNTVIVHGVGMSNIDIDDAARAVRGFVWCPSTNLYLLGKTADVSRWYWDNGVDVALGSDSRLTAAGDLLDEMQAGARSNPVDGHFMIEAMTNRPAAILGLPDVGHLRPGAHADWIAFRGFPQCRGDLALVVRGGVPQIGDPEVMARFPHIETVPATLDGVPKAIHIALAQRIQKCSLTESGLVVEGPPGPLWYRWRQRRGQHG